jgi:hypothetical protein
VSNDHRRPDERGRSAAAPWQFSKRSDAALSPIMRAARPPSLSLFRKCNPAQPVSSNPPSRELDSSCSATRESHGTSQNPHFCVWRRRVMGSGMGPIPQSRSRWVSKPPGRRPSGCRSIRQSLREEGVPCCVLRTHSSRSRTSSRPGGGPQPPRCPARLVRHGDLHPNDGQESSVEASAIPLCMAAPKLPCRFFQGLLDAGI